MNKPLWLLPKSFAQLPDLPLSGSMGQLPMVAGKNNDQHEKLVFPARRKFVGGKFDFKAYAKPAFYGAHPISQVLHYCPARVLRDTEVGM